MPITAFRRRLVSVLTFVGSSFVLHLLWENAQAPLYAGYMSFWQCFWACLYATATGDMLFMLTIYLALAVVHRDIFWVSQRASYERASTWVLAILIGILLAISFELWAVYVAHRWTYGAMPLIPIIGVGITPVLQMMIIPSGVLYFSRANARR